MAGRPLPPLPTPPRSVNILAQPSSCSRRGPRITMNALFAWLLALAGLLLALQAITVIVIAARLVKARLWAPLMQPMARAQMPDDFQLVLDVALPRLEEAGLR